MIFNCNGQTLDLSSPKVMGILNLTPDSFYDGNVYPQLKDQLNRVEQMIFEGAAIIDIGAVSTRPGALPVDEMEEAARLLPALKEIRYSFPQTIISIDTYRSGIARQCFECGAGIINDIYGGRYDKGMIPWVHSMGIPYVVMHMQGTPQNMQQSPDYMDVTDEVISFFRMQLAEFNPIFKQIILDPGFGFGKSVEHNYQLLSDLRSLKTFGFPLMVGLSRKSMINKVLEIKPDDALNGSTVLNTIALLKGADILRVHDVKEAMEAVKLVQMIEL